MIINAGIKNVITTDENGNIIRYKVSDWIKDWSEKDMLQDMDIYDSKYYEDEEKNKNNQKNTNL